MPWVLLDRSLVGVLSAREVSRVEVHVPQAEINRSFLFTVPQELHEEVDSFLVAFPAAQLLRLLQSLLHELLASAGRQLAGLRERSDKSLSFTALISCHVRYFGLPLAVLGLRRR